MTNPQTSLKHYYLSFSSVPVALVPYVSKLFEGSTAAILFPPVGTIEGVSRLGTTVLALLVTCVVFVWGGEKPRAKSRRTAVSLCVAFVFFVCYLGLYSRFVRQVDISSAAKTVYVSVGYDRTPLAARSFPEMSDEEMLVQRGPYEDQIQLLWTARSLLVVRIGLSVSYCAFLMCVVAVLSWTALYAAVIERQSGEGSKQ